METKKTHWKKLNNPDYIGAYSLEEGKDMVVEITKVSREMVSDPQGKSHECTVATLKDQKPLILNVTNCKTITKIYDTPYIEEWIGKKITLYVTKVKAFGDLVEALRIREGEPKKPTLTPKSKGWEGAKKAILSGEYTIDQIKAHYSLTPENETLLCQVEV